MLYSYIRNGVKNVDWWKELGFVDIVYICLSYFNWQLYMVKLMFFNNQEIARISQEIFIMMQEIQLQVLGFFMIDDGQCTSWWRREHSNLYCNCRWKGAVSIESHNLEILLKT